MCMPHTSALPSHSEVAWGKKQTKKIVTRTTRSTKRSSNNVKTELCLDTPIELGNTKALTKSPALNGNKLFNAIEPRNGAAQDVIKTLLDIWLSMNFQRQIRTKYPKAKDRRLQKTR